MQIIRNRRIVDDHWRHVGDDEALPGDGDIIVSLARWRRERDALIARDTGLGVRLEADERPQEIAGDLGHIQLVALDFPRFGDGRAYSSARRLRQQYGFSGEIRAVGDVLRDQLYFMHRCGFDAMEPRPDRDIADALAAFSELSVRYQGAADDPLPLYRRR